MQTASQCHFSSGQVQVRDQKAAVRAELFQHLAGLVLIPSVNALSERGVLQFLLDSPSSVRSDDICRRFAGNPGYQRVALRLLVAAGWLEYDSEAAKYAVTPAGRDALEVAPAWYRDLTWFLKEAIHFESCLFERSSFTMARRFPSLVFRLLVGGALSTLKDPARTHLYRQIQTHLMGALLGPAMVALSRRGILAQLAQGSVDTEFIVGNHQLLNSVFDLLEANGWAEKQGRSVALTLRGRYAAQISTSYGVTVSYLATLNRLPALLFGDVSAIPRVNEDGVELLVDRAMNVWGSGGAHTTYFKKVDEIVVDLFNRPLAEQPRGICDMGCGDATFLAHLYSTVQKHTLRGQFLDSHPLLLVAADYNEVARAISRRTLEQAGIPSFHVVDGDINQPASLASSMENLGLNMQEFFHVRSFLDHNRPYVRPDGYVAGSRIAKSSGAFASLGAEISADNLEENLVRHLRAWARYVGRFGLLILELHTLPPRVKAANLERTPALAYDGTHGYSDQYLVELSVFLDCAREAGLWPDPRFQARFPPSELGTVSINLFTNVPYAA